MEKMNYLLPEESGEMTLSGITTLRKMEQKLRNLFESQNYQEVMPPNFEYVELYTGLDAGFEQEKMFQFINHEGKSIALRYDFTVPLARNFALSELKEARYSYFGKVFRKEKRHKGRRTESYQVGTELLGLSEVTGDQEILGLTFMTLEALTLKNTIVEIGSAAFFKRLCELSGGDAPLFSELLEKKSLSGMKAFVDKHEMRGAPRDLLLALMTTTDLPTMKKLVLATGDEKLSQALEMLEALNLPDKTAICQIHYDFAMVPAMGYYTGLMFQVYVEGVAQAVISGGRYDKLLKQFGKTTGSIGFCVHMENVMKGLNND